VFDRSTNVLVPSDERSKKMPAAGNPQSRYVRKMHYSQYVGVASERITTRCGKRVLQCHATYKPEEVTCRTCLLILDIPVGELDA